MTIRRNSLRMLARRAAAWGRRLAQRTRTTLFGARPSVRTATGTTIYVAPDDGRGQALVSAGGFINRETMTMWRQLIALEPWSQVIDVGANYGEMLLNGSLPTGARVTAVEPNPQIFAYLKRSIEEAGIDAELIPAAVSTAGGPVALLVDSSWSGLTRVDASAAERPDDLRVDTVSLASLIYAPAEAARVLVKIDVEGNEADVLRSGLAALPRLDRFAALVEILHLPDADRAWLLEQFEVALMRLADDRLMPVAPPTAETLCAMVESGSYYPQDAVIRRRGRA